MTLSAVIKNAKITSIYLLVSQEFVIGFVLPNYSRRHYAADAAVVQFAKSQPNLFGCDCEWWGTACFKP